MPRNLKKTIIATIVLAIGIGVVVGIGGRYFSINKDTRPIHVAENYSPPDPSGYVFYEDDVDLLLKEQETDQNISEGLIQARKGFLPMPRVDVGPKFDGAEDLSIRRDLPAWKKYAVNVNVELDRPKLVIVIDDMGVNLRNSRKVIELPAPLTLSFLPYAEATPSLAQNAKAKGHELMLHEPMEPMGKNYDAGPAPLLTSLSKTEITERLRKDLDAFHGYVGVNNHMGSKFTRDKRAMTLVLSELKRRGLLFLDSKTINGTVAKEIAEMHDLPFAARDVFLDHEATPEFVENALSRLERIASNTGIAIGIGHPKSVTIDALKKWIPDVRKRGFDIVPISYAVAHAQGSAINARPKLVSHSAVNDAVNDKE